MTKVRITVDLDETVEELDFVQPHKKTPVDLISSRWIPCSESRPKHGVVLVTYKGGEIDLLRFPTAYRAKDIIAWMPLPEPPKEDDHE